MRKEYRVIVEKTEYSVLFSDEGEALLEAKAAGRAVLGLWDKENPENIPADIPYLVEEEAQVTEELLERLVRRRIRLPWKIAETKRLQIREFMPEDWPKLSVQCLFGDNCPFVFLEEEAFFSYIANQYPFYEYGIWAVVEKDQNRVIGGCGIWDGEQEETEFGYWINPDFQKKGYGTEAAGAVLAYAVQLGKIPIYAQIREDNIPSRKLADKLHFQLDAERSTSLPQERSEARKLRYRFVPYY